MDQSEIDEGTIAVLMIRMDLYTEIITRGLENEKAK